MDGYNFHILSVLFSHLLFIFGLFFAAIMNLATDGNINTCELYEIRPTIEQVRRAIASDNGDCSSLCCTLCDKAFRNRGSRHFHMRRKHGQDQPETSTALLGMEPGHQRKEGALLAFRCPMDECAAVRTRFPSAKLLIQHVQKKHTEKRHKCAQCPARFSLERDLRYHCKKVCPKREQKLGVETVPAPTTGKTVKEPAKSNPTATSNGRSAAILLVPIRVDKRILLRRILPKSAQKRTASTQTEVADDGGQQQQQTATTTMTTWLQPNANDGGQFVGNFFMGQDVATNTEFIAGGAFAANVQQQHQPFVPGGEFFISSSNNACVQTCYPQTLDFGAQYPTNPCCSSSTSSSSSLSIYLPPLLVASSTQTQHHHPACCPSINQQTPNDDIIHNGEDGMYSRKCPLKRQGSWTQTITDEDVRHHQQMMAMDWGAEEVDQLIMMEGMMNCSSSSAMASVGAQTDEDAELQRKRRMEEEEWFGNSR